MIISTYLPKTVLLLSAAMVTQLSFALPKGKPFQELKVLVEENSQQIEDNSEAIASINDSLSSIDERMVVLESSISNLLIQFSTIQDSVDSNTQAIEATFNQISALELELQALIQISREEAEAAINSLRSEVALLIAATEEEISANQEALLELNQLIIQIAEENSAIALDLRGQITDIALLIDSSSGEITALQSEMTITTSLLSILNAEFNSLSAQYIMLESQLDEQTSELEQIKTALANLSTSGAGGDSDSPDTNNNNNPINSISLTDEYSVSTIDLSLQVREFFRNASTSDRYVYVMFDSPSMNRTTEFCMKDSEDLFANIRDTEDGTREIIQGSDSPLSAYRLNNGDWADTRVKIRSSLSGAYSTITINSTDVRAASTVVADRPSSDAFDPYETRHQGSWMTINSQSDTNLTFTVANDRFSACGY